MVFRIFVHILLDLSTYIQFPCFHLPFQHAETSFANTCFVTQATMATCLLALKCDVLCLTLSKFPNQINLLSFEAVKSECVKWSIHLGALTSCEDVGSVCWFFPFLLRLFFSICIRNLLLLLHFCSFPLSNSKPASPKIPAFTWIPENTRKPPLGSEH